MKKAVRVLWSIAVIGGGLAIAAPVLRTHTNSPQSTKAAQESPVASWLNNIDAGLTEARSSGKDVLIEFATPDPTAEDVAKEAEAFDSDAFRRSAGGHFVLVRLVSSADSAPEIATKVATWGQRLGITKFPTLALLDSQGRPYAAEEMDGAALAQRLTTLETLRQVKIRRDQLFAAAERATGVDRVRNLDAALTTVGRFAGDAYLDVMNKIVALDADNSLHLRAKYEHVVTDSEVNAAIQNEVYPLVDKGELSAAIDKISGVIQTYKPEQSQLQLLKAFQGQLYYSLGNKPQAALLLDQAIAISPNTDAAAKARAAKDQILSPNP